MSKIGVINKLVDKTDATSLFHGITTGRVVSVDDPRQLGRLRVYTPMLDDDDEGEIPWAFYGSPFSGIAEDIPRGRSTEAASGPVAYGMWAIPKVGAHVLIMCINGNPEQRVWLGCLPTNLLSHTLPHGRHLEDDTSGPLTSNDSPLEPLYAQQQEAFTSDVSDVNSFESEEYKTRGADRSVSLIDDTILDQQEYAAKVDDAGGYQQNRIPGTEGNDSNIYALTSPGFHSISMDDNATSCRVRIRTTGGHQIIFDDTNERIYLSTAQGKTWIEFDEKGTIDMYAEHDISIRSQADVNITSDQTIRLAGREGVHISSEKEVRIHSGSDTNIKSDANIRVQAGEDFFTEVEGTANVKVTGDIRIHGSTLFLQADGLVHIKGTAVEIGAALNVAGPTGIVGELDVIGLISSAVDVTSPTHSLNLHTHTYILPKFPEIPPLQPGITMPQILPSGTIASASAAPEAAGESASEAVTAYFPSRAPQHEPWARTYLDLSLTDVDDGALVVFEGVAIDPDSVSEYGYADTNIGKQSAARGKNFERNNNWRR